MNIRLLFIICLFMTGCSNQINGHYTPMDIDLVSVNYHYESLTPAHSYSQQSKAMMLFMEQHKKLMLNDKVYVNWQGQQGKTLATSAQQWMLKAGVPPDYITLRPTEQTLPIEIIIETHHVQVPLCQAAQAERIEAGSVNCYTESARWQSIVNPERMLGEGRK